MKQEIEIYRNIVDIQWKYVGYRQFISMYFNLFPSISIF